MTMQYDVKAAYLSVSGNINSGRARLKQFTFAGTGGQTGKLVAFDGTTAPTTTGTYAQSGTSTVTITSTAHGLATGATVGISYNSTTGGSATDGNYTITVTGANTFTITDPNINTLSGSPPGCQYVSGNNRWITTYATLTGATATTNIPVPGEGLLATQGIYLYFSNIGFVTIHYG